MKTKNIYIIYIYDSSWLGNFSLHDMSIIFNPTFERKFNWKFSLAIRDNLSMLSARGVGGGGGGDTISNQKCYFSYPYSDLASKKLSSLLRLERQQKGMFLFLSHSFGTETINMFIHSRPVVPSNTIPVSRPKRCKNPLGRYILIWLI